MSRSRLFPHRIPLLFAMAACATPVWGASRLGGDPAKPEEAWEQELKDKVYACILPEDAKGFRLLPSNLAAAQREKPQSLGNYRAGVRIRPTQERRTIVLQPLGEYSEREMKVLELLCEYTAIFFQLPARIEKPTPLELPGKRLHRIVPIGNRHGTYDKQYNGDTVMMELLAPRLPDDALLYLGVTMADLYCEQLSYVFGVASLEKRVGVYSLCRYYPEFWGQRRSEGDDVKGLRLACKVLNHETGHIFGLRHCVFYRCSMNYSNSLAEADATPIHYCPVCHRKLLWNIGFEALRRYTALQEFYQRNGLAQEAEWLAGRIQRWKHVAAAEEAKKAQEE